MRFCFGEFSTQLSFLTDGQEVLARIPSPFMLICDENVWQILPDHLPALVHSNIPLLRVGQEPVPAALPHNLDPLLPRGLVILPAGEAAKSMKMLEHILQAAFSLDLGRDSAFVVLGGGATSDVAACASSLFMRGNRLILIPTTLLAMVDASLGGKTGINYAGYKNMLGSIYPAEEVRIFPKFLRSLPQREYLGGLAEVIKTAMLGDDSLFELLEERQADILARDEACLKEIINKSLTVKGRIVAADLREGGLRAHLNLGHTFAHALEAVTAFTSWNHGEAVAWGILRALVLGEQLGETDPAYRQRVECLLDRYKYRLESGLPASALCAAMKNDKKKQAGKLHFVLQKRLTETFQRVVNDDALMKALN